MIKDESNSMSYDDKLSLVKQHLNIVDGGTPPFDEAFLQLICMVCYLTVQYRKKNPAVTPLIILNNAAGPADMLWSKEMYQRISLLCEVMIMNTQTFPNFDITSTKEMMAKIKDIVNDWVPF